MEKKIKITLKYDDGKRKRTLYINADEFEAFLEKDYQRRLAEAKPEERDTVKKMTPEEYAQKLNRESYNNWHKYNRHTSGKVKSFNEEGGSVNMINPIDLVEDNATLEEIEENIEVEALRQKVYKYLSKSQADIFWAVVMQKQSVEELAKNQNVTPRAIYLRLETAKKKLKKFF